jgi:hypothetical protein
MDSKLYDERDIEEQGDFYVRHLNAMTEELLNMKSDIAAELAHRDIRIQSLGQQLESMTGCAQVARYERDEYKRQLIEERAKFDGACTSLYSMTEKLGFSQEESRRKQVHNNELSEQLAAVTKERDGLAILCNSIRIEMLALISESSGVAGLHHSGNLAEWEWLLNNGWLTYMNEALAKEQSLAAHNAKIREEVRAEMSKEHSAKQKELKSLIPTCKGSEGG